jgi:RNA polymerase sigma factor (sigma-70 family)
MKLQRVVRHIQVMAGAPPLAELGDGQLLQAFTTRGEQTAFATLVERHGPMVFRVCRRVLRQEQDAEDAFQATFLVLAEKASAIRKNTALASWLHGVAYRVSLRARRDAGRRRAHEREAQPMSAKPDHQGLDWTEVQAVLDEEIQSLPEKFRAPFVLCFLEGRSRAEAARELGLKEGTVWSRLSHARQLLHQKLARRGIALPALLAATALSTGTAQAMNVQLIHSTIQAVAEATTGQTASAGLATGRVAALARGVSTTMSLIQMKSVFLCLTTMALVALGAGVVVMKAPAQVPAAAPGQKSPLRVSARPAAPEATWIVDRGDKVRFTGRVLGPDGKPVAGARLTLWCHFGYEGHYRGWHPSTATPLRSRPLAMSGKDGRFSAAFLKTDVKENPLSMWNRPWRNVVVVAAAPGYGPAWASLDRPDQGELTLRLVRDDVPVKGRVVDLEGRPVIGAAVRVVRLTVGNDLHRSLFQPSWAGLPTELKTGRDGRFALSGLGRGRNVLLSIEGAAIEHKFVGAKTPAAEAAAVAQEVEVLAGPTKPIEGTVTVKGTGKPLAGVVVYGEEEAHQRRVRAVTDAQGRYRLVGLAKAKSYLVTYYPAVDSCCLGTMSRVEDSVGVQPLTANVEVRRGIEVRCRLIDKQTRQPIQAELRYSPLLPNPLYSEAELARGLVPNREFSRIHVPGPDGVFRLVVYPGLGILVGNLQGNQSRYLPVRLDPADLARAQGDGHMAMAKLLGVYRLIEPKEGDRPVTVDSELTPQPRVGDTPVRGNKPAGSN